MSWDTHWIIAGNVGLNVALEMAIRYIKILKMVMAMCLACIIYALTDVTVKYAVIKRGDCKMGKCGIVTIAPHFIHTYKMDMIARPTARADNGIAWHAMDTSDRPNNNAHLETVAATSDTDEPPPLLWGTYPCVPKLFDY